ncbi:MAG: hypothetical protein AAB156_06785, partial [Pseudomonadota bacterium]
RKKSFHTSGAKKHRKPKSTKNPVIAKTIKSPHPSSTALARSTKRATAAVLNRKYESVWCTDCISSLLPREDVIIRHFMTEHGYHPTPVEIQKVLSHSFRKKFKRSKRRVKPMPSGKPGPAFRF